MRKPRGVEARRARYGFIFLSPWIVGMALFFVVPIVQSVWFGFARISISEYGVETEFVGLSNLKNILLVNPDYVNNLLTAVKSLFVSVPFIIIVALILALTLNGSFKGRLFFRSLFFLPVLFASGPVLDLFLYATASDGTSAGLSSAASNVTQVAVSDAVSFGMINFTEILAGLNLPSSVETYLSVVLSSLFMLVWQSGIQILLFIAGLQSIPDSLYEAARVEGATKWEEFWFVTLPMLLRTILLVLVFTMVEVITLKTNPVIKQGYNQFRGLNYGVGSAMLWFYFLIAGALIAAVLLSYNRACLKRWG